jgi:putative endonuclease
VKGAWAEKRAELELVDAGLSVLERNYRVRGGEIDLIAQETDGTTVFVEVKQRRNNAHGEPGEFITARKAALIRRAALMYLGRDDLPCRFDAVLITGDQGRAHLEWLKDAF